MPDHPDVSNLFPADLPGPGHWERRYPKRALPGGAHISRSVPTRPRMDLTAPTPSHAGPRST